MEIPAINLKSPMRGGMVMEFLCPQAIVLVHWLLTIWGCMASLPSSYAWGNFTVLAVGVWAIAQRDSIDAVLMLFIGMIVSMLTDMIHIGIYYPVGDALSGRVRDTFRFSVGMGILNLLLKPASCFFIYQMYRERGGDYNINFGFPTVTRNRDNYQSIDHQDQSSSPGNTFGQTGDPKPAPRSY